MDALETVKGYRRILGLVCLISAKYFDFPVEDVDQYVDIGMEMLGVGFMIWSMYDEHPSKIVRKH